MGCGAQLQPGAAFCVACGRPRGPVASAPSPRHAAPHVQAAYRHAKRAKARVFSISRFLGFSGVSLLGIGLADGWREILQGIAPAHALLNVPTPKTFVGGFVSLAIHGFIAGILIGLARASVSGVFRALFRSPHKVSMLLLTGAVLYLLGPDAMADDGGIPELLNGAAIGPNVAVLLGAAAAAGAGLSAGVGVVTVIVNGVTSSVSSPQPPRNPVTPPGASADPSLLEGSPMGQPPRESEPQREEQEDEAPPNFTLDIRTDGGRTRIVADDLDEIRIDATVICDKPEIDTSGMAGSITFTPGGPAQDWLRLGETRSSGSRASVDVRATPPTPESELTDPDASITVRLTLGRAVFSGVVHLTVEPSDYHLELIYDDE